MRNSNAIRQLINACVDDKRMLEHEHRFLDGTRRGDVVGRLVAEQRQCISELRGVGGLSVRGDGDRGSWRELGREFKRTMRRAIGGSTEGDSVTVCRQSCHRTEDRFHQVLRFDWPEGTRALLVEQRNRLAGVSSALAAIQY